MSNQEVTLSMRIAYQGLTDIILSLTEEQFLSRMNGWSPRDVVAHLIGWNDHMIEALSSLLAGQKPGYYADAPNDYSNINAGFTAKYSSRSKQELLAELESSLDRLEAYLLSLPAGELTADHGVRHYRGEPVTVRSIIESLAGDYRSHTNEIREWLKKRQ